MGIVRDLLAGREKARGVLAAVLGILIVAVVLQLAAFAFVGPQAFGQGSPSPSPGGFTIQFLNPSGVSRELSTRNDGTDSEYHLVAWVNRLPSSPSVEFKYQGTGQNEQTIPGTVNQIGDDTFELKWNMQGAGPEATDEPDPAAPNGIREGTSGKLRVLLYSGGTEVARDEETVRVNQNDPGSCPDPGAGNPTCEEEGQASTIELSYPSNGGGLGWYRPNPGNGPNNSVFDFTMSDRTEKVTGWYTLSTPGSEPEWKACKPAAGETKALAANGVRCEYDAADSPAAVRAVAVRSEDTLPRGGTQSQDDLDTSDVHRVFPYEQDAAFVQIDGSGQGVDAGKCTGVITATVLDQASPARKIADINVDVHAGNSDNLLFDDGGGETSVHKVPENHASEGAINCMATPPSSSGQQGEHEALGDADTKHVESSTDTDDAGQFKFKLFHPSGAAIQFTAFADEDSNDRLCSEEAQGDGSAGFGQGAPTATGMPDEDTSCPRPGPTGTTSPTGSPTTARPMGTSTPTGTSTAPPRDPRTMSLTASKTRVVAGDKVTLAGQIIATDEACEDDEFVRITRRIHGQQSAKNLTTTRTNANGRFQVEVTASQSADYQASSAGHDNCADVFSSPVIVQVKVKVNARASDRSIQRGRSFTVKVKVTPNHRGTNVVLERKKGRKFVRLDREKLSRKSTARFRVKANWFGKRVLRVRWPSQDDEHETGTSKTITVRAK